MSTSIQYDRFGGPEVLRLVETADPTPGPGQVSIAVRAAGLNPIDAKTVKGTFPIRPAEAIQRLRHPSRWLTRTFPRTVGRDFAGIVKAVGDGVTGFSPGQQVLGTLRSAPGDAATAGSLTTDLLAPASDVIAMPTGLSEVVAATLGVAAQTACGALRTLDIAPGDVLAISGAAGGVGSLATQLAVRRGATVLAIASQSSAQQLSEWGAIPVSYTGDVAANLSAARTQRVSAFLDCYGGDYSRLALRIGVPARRIGTLVPSPVVLVRGVRFTGARAAQPGDLQLVAELVASGRIHPQTVQALPFDVAAVREAYRLMLDGRSRGKLVVAMSHPHRSSNQEGACAGA